MNRESVFFLAIGIIFVMGILVNVSALEEDSQESLQQHQATIDQPVKWTKTVYGDDSENILVEIPKEAENLAVEKVEYSDDETGTMISASFREITLTKKNFFQKFLERILRMTGGVISTETIGEVTQEEKQIQIENNVTVEGNLTSSANNTSEDNVTTGESLGNVSNISKEGNTTIENNTSEELNATSGTNNSSEETIITQGEEVEVEVESKKGVINKTEYKVNYETPAARIISENKTDRGKRIKVSSPENIHYENVLLFTEMPEETKITDASLVKIYWVEEDEYLTPSEVSDRNGDGIFEYIAWIAPHLSEQTFEIIVITKAEHLDSSRSFISDIYEQARELDDVWTETINENEHVRVTFETNLTSENDITVYPRIVSGNPSIEIYEKDSNGVIASFGSLTENEYNKVYLTGLGNNIQDTFDLRVVGGAVEFDHIIDPHLGTLTISGTTELCGNYDSVWDAIYVTSTGILNICAFNGTASTGFVNITLGTAGNFTVAPGGFINGTFRGGTGGAGTTSTSGVGIQGTNGNNWTTGAASTSPNGGGGGGGARTNTGHSAGGAGGAFGGAGGNGGFQGGTGGTAGAIYGQTNNLTLHSGSGGGGNNGDGAVAGGAGGAGFKVNAGLGIINIAGFVNLSGRPGTTGGGQDSAGGGGGSGGHLILYASNITVTGATLNASGGSGGLAAGGADDCGGGGGGGGRIYMVYSTISNASTTTQVLAGGATTAGCSTDPGAGTAGTIRHNSTASTFTDNAPQWVVASPSVNDSSINVGDFVTHRVQWTDDGELTYAVLEVNGTGASCDTAANVTSIDSTTFNGTSGWANLTWQIPAACEDKAIGWRIYAKDWPGNKTNVTTLQTYQVEAAVDAPPQVTINFPQNITYHKRLDLPFIFNVSLNENGSVRYSLDDGISNITMGTLDDQNFNATLDDLDIGNYTFRAYANDTAGNNNYTESVTFELVQENIDVNGTVFDADGNLVNVTFAIIDESNATTIYNETNETHEIAIPLDTNYTIEVQPNDISSIDSILFESVNFTELNSTTAQIVNIDNTNETNFTEIFAIDNQLDKNATVFFTAQSTSLFKCFEWNFENGLCQGNWNLFMDNLEPGIQYNFSLGPGDPSRGYGIIEITHAIHLDENYTYISDIFNKVNVRDDIWSETIPAGHYVRVTFEKNLTNANDITVYPRIVSGAPSIEVYGHNNDTMIANFTSLDENVSNQVLLTNLSGTQDIFDLRIIGGSVEFDYIVDPILHFTGPARSMDIEPLGNNTFVIAMINSSTTNITRSELSFTEYFTNGTIRRGPFHKDQTLGNVTAVSVEMINSTHLYLAWFDMHLLDELRAIYHLDGTQLLGPTTIDGANGGSSADVCLAHFGSNGANRTFFGWVDFAEGDFDAVIVPDNQTTTAFVGETGIDATLTPTSNFSNQIDCAAFNSSHAVLFRVDGGEGDATWQTRDFTMTARLADADLDDNIGAAGAVAVTILSTGTNNATQKRAAFAWYDGTDQDISYSVNHTNNGTGIVNGDINTTAGTGSRIDIATISNGTGPDNFVVVWYSQDADDLMAQTFDADGAALTSQFSVDSSTNATGLFNETAVWGKNGGTGWSICPGTWGVSYTNSTGASVFKTYFVNGSTWDGNGCPTPAAAADTSAPVAQQGTNLVDNVNRSNNSVTFDLRGYDNALSAIALYGNWSGSWIANQTNFSPINATYWNITLGTIPQGKYVWAAWANDTAGNAAFSTANRTFTIDTTAPNITMPFYVNGTKKASTTDTLTLNISVSDIITNPSACRIDINGTNQTVTVSSGWCNITNGFLTGLTDGNRTINVYANDSTGQFGLNNSFVVFIDTTLPRWSNNLTNSSLAGTFIHHSVNWTDSSGLIAYTFSFDNGTGSFTNDSAVSFTGTQNFSNVTKAINTTVGSTIRWRVYTNDSFGNLNVTDIFAYNTTEVKRVSVNLVYPTGNINVQKGQFFNVTLNVTCLVGTCVTINVSLDPFPNGYNASEQILGVLGGIVADSWSPFPSGNAEGINRFLSGERWAAFDDISPAYNNTTLVQTFSFSDGWPPGTGPRYIATALQANTSSSQTFANITLRHGETLIQAWDTRDYANITTTLTNFTLPITNEPANWTNLSIGFNRVSTNITDSTSLQVYTTEIHTPLPTYSTLAGETPYPVMSQVRIRNGTGATGQLTVPPETQVNDTLIAFVTEDVRNITGWNFINGSVAASPQNPDTGDIASMAFYRVAQTGDNGSIFNYTHNGSHWKSIVVRVMGANATKPINVFASNATIDGLDTAFGKGSGPNTTTMNKTTKIGFATDVNYESNMPNGVIGNTASANLSNQTVGPPQAIMEVKQIHQSGATEESSALTGSFTHWAVTMVILNPGLEEDNGGKSGLISTTAGATPFYTNASSNPLTTSSLSQGQSEIITFFVNATGDIDSTHTFFAFVNLTSNLSAGNVTDSFEVTIVDNAENSCTYSGAGNWAINCADGCNISTNVDLGGNNITLDGAGTVTITANISNWRVGRSSGTCRIVTANGGGFKA